jgi:hypothetical protein
MARHASSQNMPFTVSCTACGSRFLLGDDLFRRKVSGNQVTVKCRNCEAEIALDARDLDTLPSHEAPRRAPVPPRPKDKMGLVPPKPTADEASSVWEANKTAAVITAAQPPSADDEPEFVDADEIPASSSDAPPLRTLAHGVTPGKPQRRKRPPDDFLVGLSAGTGGILGAPTIDVSNLVSARASDTEALVMKHEQSTQRIGTIPLFDMSAVMPAASPTPQLGSASSAPMEIDIDVASRPAKDTALRGKTRQRKYLVAPEGAPTTEKSRRGGGLVWLAVVAVAAGLVLIVGLRGHRSPQPVASEPLTVAGRAPAPSSAEPAAPIAEARALPEVASAAPTAKATLSTRSASPPTASRVHSATAPGAPEKTSTPTTLETQAEPSAPTTPAVAVHPAIEPAAPGTEFDRSAAVNALESAAAQASSCRKDGDPSGTAIVTISFAPSGRVTSATIQGPPFAGTPTGGCIANTLRHAQIPAFDGDRVTVTKTVAIE